MEEQELSNFAQQLGVKFFSSNFLGDFTEEKARRFRYRFFEKVMLTEGYTALVTAHHAEDQAETVFMRLLRGGRRAAGRRLRCRSAARRRRRRRATR